MLCNTGISLSCTPDPLMETTTEIDYKTGKHQKTDVDFFISTVNRSGSAALMFGSDTIAHADQLQASPLLSKPTPPPDHTVEFTA